MFQMQLDGEFFGPRFFTWDECYIWAKSEGYPYPADMVKEVNGNNENGQ